MGFLKPELPQLPENAFIAGDAATGPSLVVRCIDSGRKAAMQIDSFLKNSTDAAQPANLRATTYIINSKKDSTMCGIACIFNIKKQTPAWRDKALAMAKRIRHRGPDWSGVYCGGSAILAHERLSIVDPLSGKQPLYSPDRRLVLAVNGEIYNHRDIRARYKDSYRFQTGSDCEVILALYRDKGIGFLEDLSGIFAFCHLRRGARRVLHCARPDRRNPPVYRLRQRRSGLLCQRTEGARRFFANITRFFRRGIITTAARGK